VQNKEPSAPGYYMVILIKVNANKTLTDDDQTVMNGEDLRLFRTPDSLEKLVQPPYTRSSLSCV
jgi:hypothetical protein